MPGDTHDRQPPAQAVGVHCPVHRVDITPCDPAELQPLLAHLNADSAPRSDQHFLRGAHLRDGRLDLCKQSLGTDNCLRVAEALQRNTQVRSLMLGTNAIGDVGAHAVARLAVHNPHLEVLYLGCNNIGPEGAQHLGDALARAEQLSGLWLKRNPVGPEGARSLARMLRTNRHLRVLDLVNTALGDEGVHALVDALCSDNRTLQGLYLSGNALGSSAAASLARLLREAPQIRGLYLSVNRLGDEGVAELAEGLAVNSTLRALDLASNGIGPSGARALFAAARHHPALQSLSLGYALSTKVLGAQANRLGDDGARLVAELLAANTGLRQLDLVRNGITPSGLAEVAQALCRNDQVVQLTVDGKLPEEANLQLARNRAAHGDLSLLDGVALIRSVYR